MQRLKDKIQFLKDPIIKKYGSIIQEVSSFIGSANKEDSDSTLPPSDEGILIMQQLSLLIKIAEIQHMHLANSIEVLSSQYRCLPYKHTVRSIYYTSPCVPSPKTPSTHFFSTST
eukprot:TRINITY_DN39643_c0_g1_i1.p1 TRINITY_DN39643_c0_g1~~TRINITY_DN39643_c0_g1_i1.p1  ORF type:complete len:115 (-),score=12.62 TRINITY_DN39643_c0_g1_i1:588-932(-)